MVRQAGLRRRMIAGQLRPATALDPVVLLELAPALNATRIRRSTALSSACC